MKFWIESCLEEELLYNLDCKWCCCQDDFSHRGSQGGLPGLLARSQGLLNLNLEVQNFGNL